MVKQLRKPTGEPASVKPILAKRASTKYRAKKDFDEFDRMEFRDKAFAIIGEYFESASIEINEVENIKSKFTGMGYDAFTCTVVNRARDRAVSDIEVRERAQSNTATGWMQIGFDDNELHLTNDNISRSDDKQKLSPKQAAELLWRDFVE